MTTFWVWGVGLVLYGLFLAWYVNWRGPLSAAETTAVLKKVSANLADGSDRNDLSVLKAFLEADDGREFYMLNVIRFAAGPVADPVTGEMKPAREVMNGYTRMFLPSLLLLAGHPAFAARKIGGFVDTWGMEPGPDWSMIGYMRYRSRRDLARMVVNPRFSGAHDFKYAAMPQTFNFPTRPMIMTLANPRIWMGQTLALAAALAQIALLLPQTFEDLAMALLPPSINSDYRGAAIAPWFLMLFGVLTIVPGCIHYFLPDGGAGVIAGLNLEGPQGRTIIGVFAWFGALQIPVGIAYLLIGLRYRPLTPLFISLILLERGLMAVDGWLLNGANASHHPPEHYASVATVILAAIMLALSLQTRRAS